MLFGLGGAGRLVMDAGRADRLAAVWQSQLLGRTAGTEPVRQQTAGSRQLTADSRQQAAGSRQQTIVSR